MNKTLYKFGIALLLFFVIPPLLTEFFYGEQMKFKPYLFINEWFVFVLRTSGLIISFVLIYVVWEKRRAKELNLIDREILIFHLDANIILIEKCIDLVNNFRMNSGNSKEVNNNVRGKIKGLRPFLSIITILRTKADNRTDRDYSLSLEKLETGFTNTMVILQRIRLFTSERSKGFACLKNIKELMILHKKELEEGNA